ncbi:MAG: hypothetical protein H6922_04905 [Pseudomonadaceae bacterium]|nr:hypothetical protein [Pseudomonadaceae bacterium]
MSFLTPTQHRRLVRHIQHNCIETRPADNPFILASGKPALFKFNLDSALAHPAIGPLIGRSLARAISALAPETTLIGGPDSAGIVVARLVVPHLQPNNVITYRIPKKPGERATDLTAFLPATPLDPAEAHIAAIVDDVTNAGTNSTASFTALQQHRLPVLHAFSVLDYGHTAASRLAAVGVQLHALTTLADYTLPQPLDSPAPTP